MYEDKCLLQRYIVYLIENYNHYYYDFGFKDSIFLFFKIIKAVYKHKKNKKKLLKQLNTNYLMK